jgi:pyruvate carboxylase
MEFRINAEDPKNDFLPSFGKITRYLRPRRPRRAHRRAIYTGYTIPPYYDSMCAKLIVWALTWEECWTAARRALTTSACTASRPPSPITRRSCKNEEFPQRPLRHRLRRSHPELVDYSTSATRSWLPPSPRPSPPMPGRPVSNDTMSKVHITDTILRDAHQSLIATRMRTEDMLPICDKLDRSATGRWRSGAAPPSTPACASSRKTPGSACASCAQALPNTRLQMLLRGQNLLGYRHYSDDVVRAFVARRPVNGIDVFRIFDALNDTRNLKSGHRGGEGKPASTPRAPSATPPARCTAVEVRGHGTQLADMGCDSIAIKDMAGLLTPTPPGELVGAAGRGRAGAHPSAQPRHRRHWRDVPAQGIENGCRHIDTAISAFSGGTSHPPTESMVAALRGTEYDTGLDLKAAAGDRLLLLRGAQEVPPVRKRATPRWTPACRSTRCRAG